MINGYQVNIEVLFKDINKVESISFTRLGKFRTYKECYSDLGEFLFLLKPDNSSKDFFKVLNAISGIIYNYADGSKCSKSKLLDYETQWFKAKIKVDCYSNF